MRMNEHCLSTKKYSNFLTGGTHHHAPNNYFDRLSVHVYDESLNRSDMIFFDAKRTLDTCSFNFDLQLQTPTKCCESLSFTPTSFLSWLESPGRMLIVTDFLEERKFPTVTLHLTMTPQILTLAHQSAITMTTMKR